MNRLLVRLPNWLGDSLMARPALLALRHAHPRARITALGPQVLLDLLATDRGWDESHAWPAERAARAALLAKLRRERFDAALVMPPSFSSAWFAWRTGARRRVGHRGEGRNMLLTHAIRRPPRGDLHLSREYLELARVLDAPAPAGVPPLAPAPEAGAGARTTLVEAGIGGGRFAILGPGARYGPAKRWSAARFAGVGRALAAHGIVPLVCGAGGERDTCAEVTAAIGGGAVSLAGRIDIGTQAALGALAAVALCNDSGLAHVMAAVGTPTVVVFGSTSSAWTAPLGPRVRVVQRAPVCSPCFQRTCRIGYVCLEAVGEREVTRACLELASGAAPIASAPPADTLAPRAR